MYLSLADLLVIKCVSNANFQGEFV